MKGIHQKKAIRKQVSNDAITHAVVNERFARTYSRQPHSAICLSWHVRDKCLVRAYTRYKSPFALFRRALGDGPMRTLTKLRKCLEVHWRRNPLLNWLVVLSNCENS
jgi:hypothetical protein